MLDQNLRNYATDSQWETLEAIDKHGGVVAAAKALGKSHGIVSRQRQAVMRKAARHGYSPEHDYTRTVPDGFKLRGVSTLYNRDGDPVMQWVKSAEDRERQLEMMTEAIAALTEDITPAKPVPLAVDATSVDTDLCFAVPIGDHHLGMYAWAEETGEDYDLTIAERRLNAAVDHLIGNSMNAASGLIAVLGDYLHYDSFETVTPSSRNQLDSDTRWPAIVRAAIRTLRRTINSALAKFQTVHVIVEIGNHDLSASVFLMECLAALYENEPRVTIDRSPKHFHYYRFGECLIGTHHGHNVKLQDLPLLMATDRPGDWGETKHRYWWTGHVHHDQVKDFAGVRVESFQVLATQDAWATNMGYRSRSSMKSIVLHREFGEIARSIVHPAMLGVT